METWKWIIGFEGGYEISTDGNVRSVDRTIIHKNTTHFLRSQTMKQSLDKSGYLKFTIRLNGVRKTAFTHREMGNAFLMKDYSKQGLDVNHKDLDKTNNKRTNLELITERGNTVHYRESIKHSSRYTGVSWRKQNRKWRASIIINKEQVHLGYFLNEEDASIAYQNKLKSIV